MLTLKEANKENPYNLEERLLISRGYLDYSHFSFVFSQRRRKVSNNKSHIFKGKIFQGKQLIKKYFEVFLNSYETIPIILPKDKYWKK